MGEEIQRIVKKGRFGLELEPIFEPEKIIFFRIDRKFKGELMEGEVWIFERTSSLIDTGKKDCYGTPIFYQYVLPKKRAEWWKFDYEEKAFNLVSGKRILRKVKAEKKSISYDIGYFGLYRDFVYVNPETGKEISSREEVSDLEEVPLEVKKKWWEIQKKLAERMEAWEKKMGVVKYTTEYWYCPPKIQGCLPTGWYYMQWIESDEKGIIIWNDDWNIVSGEDFVILTSVSGKVSEEVENLYELVALERYLTIIMAQKAFKPATLGDFEAVKRFIRVQFTGKTGNKELDEWFDHIQRTREWVRGIIFGGGKEINSEEKENLAIQLMFGSVEIYEGFENEQYRYDCRTKKMEKE